MRPAARRAAKRERHGRREAALRSAREGSARSAAADDFAAAYRSEYGPGGPYGALKRACEEWGDRNLPRPCASDAAD